jgi:hypothetical protein
MSAARATATVVLLLGAMSVYTNAAEIALVPVSASGPHEIVGNEIILYGADQVVTLELYASDWQPWLVSAFQIAVDSSGAISGDAGELVPFGWDNPDPYLDTVCAEDSDCPEVQGQVCWFPEEGLAQGFCAGPDHHLQDGVFLDETHPDYIFHGLGTIGGVDLVVWNPLTGTGFRYGAFVTGEPSEAGVPYTPPPKYCGTLKLVAPPDTAGTFTMELEVLPATFLVDFYHIIDPDLTPALITILPAECGNGICDSGEDIVTCPEDCAPPPIPAASTWGLVVMMLLALAIARVAFGKRRTVV